LRRTVRRFPQPGRAIDLGCGNGIETLFLLLQGWRVLAVDQEALAIETLRGQVTPGLAKNLQTRVVDFAALDLPQADLIWAGYSLPFCPPDQFDLLWRKIVTALKPNGRFAGDLFGSRHGWVRDKQMTFFTKAEVMALCQGLYLEYLVEEEGEQAPAGGECLQWHMFTLCARKDPAD
jgi:SAM-dependent methyltransferase